MRPWGWRKNYKTKQSGRAVQQARMNLSWGGLDENTKKQKAKNQSANITLKQGEHIGITSKGKDCLIR